jgi:hypothetical protein
VPLLFASLGFAVAALAVHAVPLAWLVGLAPAALVLALFVLPAFPARTETSVRPPRWDLPARAIITAGVVLLLAVYPAYSAILASFALRLEGRAAAIGLLRGLLVGLFSFAAFYSLLAFLLPHTGTGGAFAAAIAAAVMVQGVSLLRILRRQASRSERDRPTAAPSSPLPAAPPR